MGKSRAHLTGGKGKSPEWLGSPHTPWQGLDEGDRSHYMLVWLRATSSRVLQCLYLKHTSRLMKPNTYYM